MPLDAGNYGASQGAAFAGMRPILPAGPLPAGFAGSPYLPYQAAFQAPAGTIRAAPPMPRASGSGGKGHEAAPGQTATAAERAAGKGDSKGWRNQRDVPGPRGISLVEAAAIAVSSFTLDAEGRKLYHCNQPYCTKVGGQKAFALCVF